MRVLIAEDDEASALLLRQTLEKWGHSVIVAEDGLAAWNLFLAERPAVVVADWMMPNLDGAELCRRIRSLRLPQYTYFVLVTAKESREDRIEGLQAGADDFIGKPVDTRELFARLEAGRRILDMQEQLRTRTADLESLHTEVERRNAELNEAMDYLSHANVRFTELFEGLPIACYSWDREGFIHQWNRAAVAMFGYQPEEVLMRRLWEVFSSNQPRKRAELHRTISVTIQRVFEGEAIDGLEQVKWTKSGRRVLTLCNILPMRARDGIITGGITALIDISERKDLERKLETQLRLANRMNKTLARQRKDLEQANDLLSKLATTDGLTGLHNHRNFRESLEACYAQTLRDGAPCSVIMLDVDRFKQYNDDFGHPAGDDVLRILSEILKKSVRRYDVVARYGGEEFIVLCRTARHKQAMHVAERLRSAIESYNWPLRPVTSSLGVSTYRPSTASASDLIDEADRALYSSKRAGRNRITHFDEIVAPCTWDPERATVS
jgi:two-component system cell cycle response regulator